MTNKATSPSYANDTPASLSPDRLNHFYYVERTAIKCLVSTLSQQLHQYRENRQDQPDEAMTFASQDTDEFDRQCMHTLTRFRHYLTVNFRTLLGPYENTSTAPAISLVKHSTAHSLEYEVLCNNMIARGRCELSRPLLQTLSLLRALLPSTPIDSSNNPLDPHSLMNALALSLTPLRLPSSTGIRLYQHIATALNITLASALTRTNDYLLQQGLTAQSHNHTPITARPAPAPPTNNTADTSTTEATVTPTPKQLTTSYPKISTQHLVQLIHYLQRCLSKQSPSLYGLTVFPFIHFLLHNTDAPHERRALLDRDRDVLRLLDRTFCFMHSQPQPAALRTLLTRLQLPLCKIALCDTTFLSDRHHPARQFLNGICAVQTQWELANEQWLPPNTINVLHQIIEDAAVDPRLYRQLVQGLSHQRNQRAPRIAVLEQRLIEREQGKDSAEHARSLAYQLLHDRLQGKAIHPDSLSFLLGPWQQVLFQHYLRDNADADATKTLLALTQHIIQQSSHRPPNDMPSAILLAKLDPYLLQVSTGPQQHTALRTQLMLAIQHAHEHSALGDYPCVDNTVMEPLPPPHPSTVPHHTIDPQRLAQRLQEIDNIPIGTWCLFGAGTANASLCKLSHQFSHSTRLLFTLGNGLTADILSRTELAIQVYQHNTLVLREQRPLFDRALRHANEAHTSGDAPIKTLK